MSLAETRTTRGLRGPSALVSVTVLCVVALAGCRDYASEVQSLSRAVVGMQHQATTVCVRELLRGEAVSDDVPSSFTVWTDCFARDIEGATGAELVARGGGLDTGSWLLATTSDGTEVTITVIDVGVAQVDRGADGPIHFTSSQCWTAVVERSSQTLGDIEKVGCPAEALRAAGGWVELEDFQTVDPRADQ